jgi:hypothetical protein
VAEHGCADLVAEPRSLPVLRGGLEELTRLVGEHAGGRQPVVAIEATGNLHRPSTAALEQRFPGSVRLFGPSETTAAWAQLDFWSPMTQSCTADVLMSDSGTSPNVG